MANLNKVMLLGNLTRDPELRHTPKGSAVADLGLAVNRRTQDGSGGWKDETTFVDVTVWGASAENAHKYLTKGRGVFIEGRLQMDSWDDKATGQKRTKLKVVAENLQFMPDGKAGSGGAGGGSKSNFDGSGQSSSDGNRQGGTAGPPDDYQEEDDIPF
jgi:single-strand DNA-binding protein